MILDRILATKRDEVAAPPSTRLTCIARVLDARRARDFKAALRRGAGANSRIRAIAEMKRMSPSAGPIRPQADAAAIAAEYEAHGAAAVSVLTDKQFFGGSLADLTAVRARVGIPVLRKDFLVEPAQVIEARAAGADAVLLIVRALDDALLVDMLAVTRELGMAALVEVHDADEADRAVAAGARDHWREPPQSRHARHRHDAVRADRAAAQPDGRVTVAESGIRGRDEVAALAQAGADAILVGESLMRQPSPGTALAELLR